MSSDRDRLTTLRDRLEAVVTDPETPVRELAAVSREYRMTLDALARLAPPSKGSKLDEIAARRKARSSA